MGKSIGKIILLFLLSSSNCFADNFKHIGEWGTSKKLEFSTFVALSAIDYSQTSWALRQKDSKGEFLYYEVNPFYGKRPSNEELILGQLIAIGSYYWAIGGENDNSNSKFIRGLIMGTKIMVVLHNDSVGIRISKSF